MTPELVKTKLESGDDVVGFLIGESITPAGKVVQRTDSGKTLKTDRGYTFKYRQASKKYALKGNPHTSMVFVHSAPDQTQ